MQKKRIVKLQAVATTVAATVAHTTAATVASGHVPATFIFIGLPRARKLR